MLTLTLRTYLEVKRRDLYYRFDFYSRIGDVRKAHNRQGFRAENRAQGIDGKLRPYQVTLTGTQQWTQSICDDFLVVGTPI